MRLYRNERLIKRNKFLGRVMMFGGLGASFAAVLIVFLQPALLSLAFGLMLAGGLFSQLGTAVYNRFGRGPRIDEVLDDSLKGFTPAGVFALIPRDEKGEVRYESDQWILKLSKRRFGRSQKTLKDVERIAARETNALERALTKKLPICSEIPVDPLLVFVADEATLDLDGAPIAAVHRKKLKSYLRRLERQKSYSAEEIQQLASAYNLTPDDPD